MIAGLVGIIIPILPGILLIWLSVLLYAIREGFQAIDWITFTVITLIALVAGTADLWLPLLGSKRGGASGRAMVLGLVGGIVGFFLLGAIFPIVGSLFGGIVGYAAGVLLGQYHKYRDWNVAIKAGVGGVVGWGVATVVQLVGAGIMILLFLWQVLAY